jgi:hypothetical protein
VRALVAFLLANASYRCTKGRSGVWAYVVVTIPAMAGFGRFCQLAPLELDMRRQYQLDFVALVQSLARLASVEFCGRYSFVRTPPASFGTDFACTLDDRNTLYIQFTVCNLD